MVMSFILERVWEEQENGSRMSQGQYLEHLDNVKETPTYFNEPLFFFHFDGHLFFQDIGARGAKVLCKVLHQDNADIDITKAVLETLTVLCQPEAVTVYKSPLIHARGRFTLCHQTIKPMANHNLARNL